MPDFGTESGGLSNFVGVIHDAYFIAGEYGTSLNLKIALDNPELYPNVEGGETTLFLACGGGWTPEGDGDKVVHSSGNPAKHYNVSSELGVLTKRLRDGDLGNFDAFMADVTAPGDADFSMYRASSWKGLRFRFDEVEYESRKMGKDAEGNDTGQWVAGTKTRRMPVEYLGKAGQPLSATNGSGAASLALDLAALSLPPEILTAAKDAATASTSDQDFAVKVAGIPGAMANEGLQKVLVDTAQVSALKAALVGA